MNFGGLVELEIPDPAKVDRAKALTGFGFLWGQKNAESILASVLETGRTGATFTGSDEKCQEFVALMQGSGVEVEVLMRAFTQAQIEDFSRSLAGNSGGES